MSCAWCYETLRNVNITVDTGKWDYLHHRWQICTELVCSEPCRKALDASNANYVQQIEHDLKHQDEIALNYTSK